MNAKLEITQIGNSLGILIPPEILEKLNLEAGDYLKFEETDKGYRVSRESAEFQRQMEIAERVMRENHDLLRRLAREDTHPDPDRPEA